MRILRILAPTRARLERRKNSFTIGAAKSQVLTRILLLWFLAVCLANAAPAAQGPAAPPLEIGYLVRVLRPTTHLVNIEIEAHNVSTPTLDFVLPAWAPGRYAIYNFAKNVQEFSAQGAGPRALPWSKIDKQTWRVSAAEAEGTVKVNYFVYANDLTGSFSQVDSTHANLNGPSVFMYVDGHKPDPVTLQIEVPPQWKVISGFSKSTSARAFRAANYDRLADTPLELSPECTLDEFEIQGRTIQVAVHTFAENDGDRSRLLEGLKKLVQAESAAMPPPDFDHYLFIFHFAPDISVGDGMEHLNSTQIIIANSVKEGSDEALETAAHEFFHVWNVKRLRPAGLGPFDYTRENYSRSLWVAEGLTTYYGYYFLLQSGLWSREEFLHRLANEIHSLEGGQGRRLMSAEASSFNAWFFDRSPQMQETNYPNTTISYYNKGALLGMLLDLEVHARTEGRNSLLDVLRSMYRAFYQAPAADYYEPGRGYEESDLIKTLNDVTGSDFAPFFKRYVEGTDPLPYGESLEKVGLQLRVESAPDAAPSLGVLIRTESQGVRVLAVIPGGAADRAGISRDDLLIDVDDQSLATEDLPARLRAYPASAAVPITLERHGRRERVTPTLDPPVPSQYAIVPSPSATREQIALRNVWLGAK